MSNYMFEQIIPKLPYYAKILVRYAGRSEKKKREKRMGKFQVPSLFQT